LGLFGKIDFRIITCSPPSIETATSSTPSTPNEVAVIRVIVVEVDEGDEDVEDGASPARVEGLLGLGKNHNENKGVFELDGKIPKQY
jgi:hypothetical protein